MRVAIDEEGLARPGREGFCKPGQKALRHGVTRMQRQERSYRRWKEASVSHRRYGDRGCEVGMSMPWAHGRCGWPDCMEWSVQSTHGWRIALTLRPPLPVFFTPLCNVGRGSETTATEYEAVNQCAK